METLKIKLDVLNATNGFQKQLILKKYVQDACLKEYHELL